MCLAQQQNRHAPRSSHQPGPETLEKANTGSTPWMGHAKPEALFSTFTFRISFVPNEISRLSSPKAANHRVYDLPNALHAELQSTKQEVALECQKNPHQVASTSRGESTKRRGLLQILHQLFDVVQILLEQPLLLSCSLRLLRLIYVHAASAIP